MAGLSHHALLKPAESGPTTVVVIGLGYGDEGKGGVVDHLVHALEASWVVRFNGGPQAAHHVVTPDGATHCFSQLGSGSFRPGTSTLLSRWMLVDPLALEREAAVLSRNAALHDALLRVVCDPNCVVVTPFHRAMGRMLELSRGEERHGSCGLGVGRAWLDSSNPHRVTLRYGEARSFAKLREKLHLMQQIAIDHAEQLVDLHPALAPDLASLQRPQLADELARAYHDFACHSGVRISEDSEVLETALRKEQSMIFEGAQGVLLDPEYGFLPHVTKTRTTTHNARELLSAWSGRVVTLGVTRAYATRHGAGPFVTEDGALSGALPEQHNVENPWQGPMRTGWLDEVALRYALSVAGPLDGIAVTHLDRVARLEDYRVCQTYHEAGDESKPIHALEALSDRGGRRELLTHRLHACVPVYERVDIAPEALAERLGVPLLLTSTGPTRRDKTLVF